VRIKPLVSLIVANLVPLLGVLFFNWSLFSILFLYWLESAVVGAYNLFKITKASAVAPPNISQRLKRFETFGKPAIIFYFIFHYSMFMIGHIYIIRSLFEPAQLPFLSLLVALTSLVISHGISYRENFLRNKEYLKVSPSQQMMVPYKRIMLMQATLVIGASIVQASGSPFFTLLIIVAVKILIDVLAHLREHFGLGTYDSFFYS
jgi:hypothetical protein